MLHTRLTAAPRGATGDHGTAEAHITRALLAVLTTLVDQIKACPTQIAEQLTLHADAHIFTSLPRAGTVRAARLLAEIGDCRSRFPTPEAWPAWPASPLHPPIRQDPRRRLPLGLRQKPPRRRHRLRRRLPPRQPLGRRPLPTARARGHDHPHATRILARAWLYIIWHCWQTNTAYNPTQHGASNGSQPRSSSAA